MAPGMSAIDRNSKIKPDGASAGAWRAVLAHFTDHQQPIRDSYC